VWNDPNPSAVLVMIDSMVESSNTLTVALVQLPLRIDGTIKVKKDNRFSQKTSQLSTNNTSTGFNYVMHFRMEDQKTQKIDVSNIINHLNFIIKLLLNDRRWSR